MNDTSNAFYSQQSLVHEWAGRVYLSEAHAEALADWMLSHFDVPPWRLWWSVPGLVHPSEAATVRDDATGGLTVAFESSGTCLLVLCHELAHVVNEWELPGHGFADWDVTTLLLELAKEQL